MTEREVIQFVSLLVTLAAMVVMGLMVWRRVLSWMYIVLPFLVMTQQVAFYIFVFIQSPVPSETITTWSSIIRLETVLAFFVVLLAYWRAHVIHKPDGE
jgi:hypothetical protein